VPTSPPIRPVFEGDTVGEQYVRRQRGFEKNHRIQEPITSLTTTQWWASIQSGCADDTNIGMSSEAVNPGLKLASSVAQTAPQSNGDPQG
jgi:hypothetical protein